MLCGTEAARARALLLIITGEGTHVAGCRHAGARGHGGVEQRKAVLPELEVDLALPEPPSKRARRALKKGKPARAAKHASDDDDLDGLDAEQQLAAADRKPRRSGRRTASGSATCPSR